MRARIRARYVVGHDGNDHVVHEPGEVVFEDDVITFVGRNFPGQVDIDIDEGLALVAPGFIDLNALGDVDHAVFDTYQADDLAPGLVWSSNYVSRRHDVFDRDEKSFRRRYAFGQLLLNGVTTALPIASEVYQDWSESYEEMSDAVQAAVDVGLRVYLGPSYRSSVPVVDPMGRPDIHEDPELGRRGLEAAERFVRDFDDVEGGLVKGMLAPSRIENQTLEQLRRTRDVAEELDCPVRLHAGQTLGEVGQLAQRYGMRPIELLDSVGFLTPRSLIAHSWAVDGHSQMGGDGAADLDRLRDSGATVIFCPMAIARYAVVLESFDRYRAHGVAMGMGTDTAPPDMIRAMDTGMVLTKAVERSRSAGSIADLYRAATLGGARALGRTDLGRLAPGTQADLIVVDYSNPRFGPVDDPIRSLVMNGSGRDIRRVVVAGRTVVRDGALCTGDQEEDRRRAQDHLAAYRASFSERDHLRRPEGVLFPPTFRIVRNP